MLEQGPITNTLFYYARLETIESSELSRFQVYYSVTLELCIISYHSYHPSFQTAAQTHRTVPAPSPHCTTPGASLFGVYKFDTLGPHISRSTQCWLFCDWFWSFRDQLMFSRFSRVEACDRLPSLWRLDCPPYMHIIPLINLLNDLESYLTFFLLGLSPRTGYRHLLEWLLSVLRGTHPVVVLLTQI